MKKNALLLILFLALLTSFGCAKSNDEKKNVVKSTEQPLIGAIPPTIPGEKPDHARNSKNRIGGQWTVLSVSSTRNDANSLFFQKIVQDQNQIELKVDDDPQDGTAKLHFTMISNKSTPPCTFTVDFDLIYCCEKMRKITLVADLNTAQESTFGCAQAAFGKNPNDLAQVLTGNDTDAGAIEMTYHFNFYKGHLNLRGPYPPEDNEFKGPYENPPTEIRLVPLKK